MVKRILVTSAGGRLAIGFTRALRLSPEPLHLIGADINKFTLQRAEVDERYLVPRASDPAYIPALLDLIDATQADLVLVNHSKEMPIVSAARDQIPARLFLPDDEAITICDSKWESYRRWQQAGVPVPQTRFINSPEDLRQAFQDMNGKLWLRSIRGSSGAGSLPVDDVETAIGWVDMKKGWGSFTASELLGKSTLLWESVWMDGELLFYQGAKGHYWEFGSIAPSGVSGITGAVETCRNAEADDIAIRAVRAVSEKPHGIMSVDIAYAEDGRPMVTEINAGRVMAGGMCHFASEGPNLALIALNAAFGKRLSEETLANPFPDGIVCIHGLDTMPVLKRREEIDKSGN